MAGRGSRGDATYVDAVLRSTGAVQQTKLGFGSRTLARPGGSVGDDSCREKMAVLDEYRCANFKLKIYIPRSEKPQAPIWT